MKQQEEKGKDMELQVIQYTTSHGWSVTKLPELDSKQTLILVFSASEFIHDTAPIQYLKANYPQSQIIGCSTAGEIVNKTILGNSLSVAIIKFDKTWFNIIKEEINEVNHSYAIGEAIAKKLNKQDLCNIFVLSSGIQVNGSALVEGLNSLGRKEVIITGGLAADGNRFKQTWVIIDGEIYTDHIVAVGFYGNNFHIGHASRGGWEIFGPERLITRSHNNVLYELDGAPALTLYKEYLGAFAVDLPASGLLYPLAVRSSMLEEPLVRTILGIDEKAQSLIFAGDVPQGHYAQLMTANSRQLITSAGEAGRAAINMLAKDIDNNGPVLVIAISCVGRKLLLGERTEDETEETFKAFPKGSKQVGFYSYGEISPHQTGLCNLHNQTMTLTALYES